MFIVSWPASTGRQDSPHKRSLRANILPKDLDRIASDLALDLSDVRGFAATSDGARLSCRDYAPKRDRRISRAVAKRYSQAI
ncbi:hypothetical protein A6X20_16815 [Bradyrhizobium elkanii]|nr:hypothetical protein A6452_38950 [Bradyrhizobium elkanii]ODM82782.1 hypothetical protein A6X20_16815 [Bradyrhizobium elkanii]